MITSVTRRAVPVHVSVVARKQPLQGRVEIFLGPAPRLHQGETRRGVRQEHM
jgi:hypothetical protein